MSKRKNIPKGLRFEVFKRDAFKCQHCGECAPNVILECDHIIPVVEGGKNEMINLVTSCRDCNRGKGKRLLSDNQAVLKQRNQLEALSDAKEQSEMMVEWRRELMALEAAQINALSDYLGSYTRMELTDEGRRSLAKLIRRFGFEAVFSSTQISFERYFSGDMRSWEYAFSKIGGVCYNRKHGRTWDGE